MPSHGYGPGLIASFKNYINIVISLAPCKCGTSDEFDFRFLLFSLQLMVVLFCIPGVAPAILAKVSDVDEEIIRDAVRVLYVFCLFPVPSM